MPLSGMVERSICLVHGSGKILFTFGANGIDVYFENVGGAIWQAVLPLLNQFARVPVCGLIA